MNNLRMIAEEEAVFKALKNHRRILELKKEN
jgi:hypothetical protein